MHQRLLQTATLALALAAAPLALPAQAAEPASSAEEIRPLMVGTSVPDVEIHALDGKAVSIREVVSKQPTVLIFYRGGW